MKQQNLKKVFFIFLTLILAFNICQAQQDYTRFVNRMIGTGGDGAISPTAAVPFGMVQCGPNTRTEGSGYHYNDKQILGFSHVNKSGGGCGDFLDVLFVPLNPGRWDVDDHKYPAEGFPTPFSHQYEEAHPGYYQVMLDKVGVQITATARCAFHQYVFKGQKNASVAIDLHHGNTGTCTIVSEDDHDKVLTAALEVVDSRTIKGWRLSSGWAKEQHVYFYVRFSKPFTSPSIFADLKRVAFKKMYSGTDIRGIFNFNLGASDTLKVKVGISPVSCDGARKNLDAEITQWDFNAIREKASDLWNKELSKINIETNDIHQKRIFYTGLYNVALYPSLYADVDGKFRGPDHHVHQLYGANYYGGVMGLWDTFRAAVPLTNLLRPDIINQYVQTMLAHYRYSGQLPIWVLAGNETYQMLGLHSIPVITDAYLKGIRNYDVEYAYQAMKNSDMKDTIGYSMRYFVGLKNYKKLGYVPADQEMEATARTLEYAYDDWCMAQMAKTLHHTADYEYFIKRSKNYKNVFDKSVNFMNGRFGNGSFRKPLDPFYCSHRRDDFCEGNAWQWTFFVPHDVNGLAELFGGTAQLAAKLDGLYAASTKLTGEASGDITGLIGQYAHGNEPSHHIPYLYNYVGQAWKTQKITHQILTTLYQDSPTGICGNDDTGQMSAWYVFSAMGFYPVNPSSQLYDIGSPLFSESSIDLPNHKKFTVTAKNVTAQNIYIQQATLNNKPLIKPVISYQDIIKGGHLLLVMGNQPKVKW